MDSEIKFDKKAKAFNHDTVAREIIPILEKHNVPISDIQAVSDRVVEMLEQEAFTTEDQHESEPTAETEAKESKKDPIYTILYAGLLAIKKSQAAHTNQELSTDELIRLNLDVLASLACVTGVTYFESVKRELC